MATTGLPGVGVVTCRLWYMSHYRATEPVGVSAGVDGVPAWVGWMKD